MPPFVFVVGDVTARVSFLPRSAEWLAESGERQVLGPSLGSAAKTLLQMLALPEASMESLRIDFSAGTLRGYMENNTIPREAWFYTFAGGSGVHWPLSAALESAMAAMDDCFGRSLYCKWDTLRIPASQWHHAVAVAERFGCRVDAHERLDAGPTLALAAALRDAARAGELDVARVPFLKVCEGDSGATIE